MSIKFIRIVPGIAVPEYMRFLIENCEPARHTKEAVEKGHLLLIDYHPPYIELECTDIEKIIEKAKRRRLRIYIGKRHITVSDGIYTVRIYRKI